MRWLLLPVFRDLSDISGLPLQVPTSPETPGLNFVRGGLLFTQLSNTSDKPADISSTTELYTPWRRDSEDRFARPRMCQGSLNRQMSISLALVCV
jgi:hypothetical protein